MTNDQIRTIFLANGFTIKPGNDDLKPCVYSAARALLAARHTEPTHLTDEQLLRALHSVTPAVSPDLTAERGGGLVPSQTLRDLAAAILRESAAPLEQKPAPKEPVSMPPYWSVDVKSDGATLVSIGNDWLSGSRPLEDFDERTILGAAQHLLGFIGYGLPPCDFNPDESAATLEPADEPATDGALKPCPFCGSRAAYARINDGENQGGYVVFCEKPSCGVSTEVLFPLMDDVRPLLAERWNSRAPRANAAPRAALSSAAAADEPATVAELTDLVRWAYSKLHQRSFTGQDDALKLDEMKLFLEHGRLG